jgi:hypothetical protein
MKTKTAFILSLTVIITLVAGSAFGAYSGGTGEPNNPYQIANVADFNQLSLDPNNWNKSFIMTADVNLAGVTLTPVGNNSKNFTGVFDGNDNIISNAVINQPSSNYIGLFGDVGSGGQIRNLGVEDVNITGSYHVGGMVGYNNGTLTECYATGSVSGTGDYVGGLAGRNNSTLIECYATGSVTGSFCVSGLVGYNNGLLTACYATGSVTGTGSVGGMVGYNNGGVLTACYATGSVSGTGYGVGGLTGYNGGTLTACYATGLVTGTGTWVGGLAGWNNGGTLIDCYATGSVTGTDFVGGLVGSNYGTLTDCYATGSVTGTATYVSGLVGYNNGMLTACFWDIQTSGQTNGVGGGTSTGVTDKTTAEMKTLSTFTSAGWDFVEAWGIGNGQTSPYLKSFNGINPADINYSGMVDMQDFAILAEHWLEGVNP